MKENNNILKFGCIHRHFTFIRIVVIDVNECEDRTHACYFTNGCNNTRGGYKCFCDTGYIVDPDDSFNCQGKDSYPEIHKR